MIVKAVLFDLDGTLIDTAPDFVTVLNQLRRQESLPPLPEKPIRNTVSHGARALITLAFGLNEDESGFEPLRIRLLDLYLQHLQQHLLVKSVLFPGIAGLLKNLQHRQLPWGIATNKPELYTTALLKALHLCPDCIICPDHVQNPKPHPESMHLAAQQLGCNSTDIIYIGDHARDIECGRRADCITIAAAYGYIDTQEEALDWQATHTVQCASDILPIINTYL